MAKGNKGAAQAAPVVVAAPAAVQGAGTAQAKVVPGVLQVKAGANLRGARAAWYAALQAHNGKPVAEFLAATQANPPSTPSKGALAGKGEPPAGWLGWFKRQGLCTVVVPGAQQPEA